MAALRRLPSPDFWKMVDSIGAIYTSCSSRQVEPGTVFRTKATSAAHPPLDSTDGRLSFPDGLVSRSGWAVVDDSQSLVFNENEWLQPRQTAPEKRDLYFFGYAQDYLAAITEYQLISGKPGLLPRWALGNWWSRYWAYSDQELLDLMEEFKQHHSTRCIVDMDWHITKTGNTSSVGLVTPGTGNFSLNRPNLSRNYIVAG